MQGAAARERYTQHHGDRRRREGRLHRHDSRGHPGARGDRISNVRLKGVPLNPAANYQVTLNTFLADGGDAFTVFTQGTNRIGGGDDLAAFATYLGVNSPVSAPTDDRINGI